MQQLSDKTIDQETDEKSRAGQNINVIVEKLPDQSCLAWPYKEEPRL